MDWPPDSLNYDPCPECGGKTWGSSGDPLDATEARRRKLRAEFERYCAKRDRQHEAYCQRQIEELEKALLASDAAA